MPKVLVFKETILPPSETFIIAQMRSLRRYTPSFVGLEPTPRSLPLDSTPLLLSSQPTKIADFRSKIYRRIGIAPLFHERVKALHVDLIHAHFACGGQTILPLRRKLKVPLVVSLHGGSDVPVDTTHRGIYRDVASEADLFICVSDFMRNEAIKAGYPPEKLLLHYIGIDLTFFSPQPEPVNDRNILFIGRLVERKGCEYALRAVKLLEHDCPEAHLTVIGDGPLRTQLELLARELGVNATFLGVQTPEAVREHLRRARVFCLPSVLTSDGDSEGLGMVFAEAQAMGVPVVSTFHGGIPEVVRHEETGLLCPERNSDALAEALERLINDSELHATFRKEGVRHISERFDLEHQTAKLEEIYDSARAQVK